MDDKDLEMDEIEMNEIEEAVLIWIAPVAKALNITMDYMAGNIGKKDFKEGIEKYRSVQEEMTGSAAGIVFKKMLKQGLKVTERNKDVDGQDKSDS